MNPKTLLRIPWCARCAAAVVVGLGSASAAPAFYFKGWPGDQLPRPPVLISPSAPIIAHPPSARIDTRQPTPIFPTPTLPMPTPWMPPPTTNGGGNLPKTPEPGTILLALAGVGALAARRQFRRVRG